MEEFEKGRTMPFYLVDVRWDGFQWVDNRVTTIRDALLQYKIVLGISCLFRPDFEDDAH